MADPHYLFVNDFAVGTSADFRFEIPATLHDSLMARLDRLGAAKEVAQVGNQLVDVGAAQPRSQVIAGTNLVSGKDGAI